MPRLRTNNVFGTTTNNPLLIAGVTLNSAGLANLPVIAAPDIAVLTLDPNRVNGAPEIVHVTAHTGSATSATILRGQEGTAARQHPLGTFWVHAASATDWGTDWALWTPTLTNLTLGNGSVLAQFAQATNDTIHFRFRFTLGSTSAVGTGPTFSLPVAAHADYASLRDPIGPVHLRDATGSNRIGTAYAAGSTCSMFALTDAATALSAITATVPHTWAVDDNLAATGTYQAA